MTTYLKNNATTVVNSLISNEVQTLLKEYFNSTRQGRQQEVQNYLLQRLERETLVEFINNPKKGKRFVRENYTDRFYWWADEDIEHMFKNWED